MSNLDSLLQFMHENSADELRLGTGDPPQMLAHGIPKRLTIAATDDATFRFLLAGILTPEREGDVRARGEVEVGFDAGPLGTYRTLLRVHPSGTGLQALLQSGAAPEPEPVAPVAAGEPLLVALLQRAAGARASDVHLAEGERPRLRIDGCLQPLEGWDAPDLDALLALDPARRARLEQGLAVEYCVSDPSGGSARVHVYRAGQGVAAAIRILPPEAPTLASLNLPLPLDDLTTLPHGLVLVCGASGSGKSTTLAALAQAALRERSIVLVTLEDPIEYGLVAGRASLLRRREVGRDVADFTAGLRDALRENPDVLLVGELRDSEAIRMAMTAAETGHLVLATLHARSAASAITRLIDAYPAGQQEQARRQLAESLRVVVAQRLLPRARPPGRVPALEVLRINSAASSLIREGKTSQLLTVLQSGRADGMLVLERCLAEQVRDGVVTLEAARAAANDPASLTLQLGGGRAG